MSRLILDKGNLNYIQVAVHKRLVDPTSFTIIRRKYIGFFFEYISCIAKLPI